MKLGYTLDDEFDPEHLDFYTCCDYMHIHKAAKILSCIKLTYVITEIVFLILHSHGSVEDPTEESFIYDLIFALITILIIPSLWINNYGICL
uniref:Uncharacterized protein n=1 Tax=Acrobeloides nanus TaxID=290746 RepID=A0A914D2P1_9BILA